MKLNPYFGRFGGQFVPEILIPALDQLEEAFIAAKDDPTFQQELHTLLTDYAGRPTPLTKCRNLTQGTKTTIYLKREDLVHGGAHKTNQVLGQALLARRMGKTRIIAETGAGQHGVATAIACALLGFKCRVYMGAKDVERQKPNVFRMELMGAEVVPVHNGRSTLKEACNAALRDWAGSFADTHYMLGTAAGPHPFPTIVREFQKIIGEEARAQFAKLEGGLPDAVIACVGGGSNAIGLFTDFVPHKSVKLIGVEPAGRGLDTPDHGATLEKGTPGIFFGARSYNMQTPDGQIEESFSISAGLDFPSVGPEHAYLQEIGRAEYHGITDREALSAFIEASAQRALAAGSTTAKCLGIIKAFRAKHPDIPVSLMLYVNLVTAPGVENFFAAAKDAGVDAVLIPDVPISMREAESEWDAAAKAHGIHLIAIAPPNGTPDLYKEVAQRSTGYVYLLSRAGITGTDKTAGRPGEAEIAALRAAGSAPLLLGFGVSRPEHVRAALEAGADGAIAGSAVAQVITENLSNIPVMLERLTAFVKEMKAATALS